MEKRKGLNFGVINLVLLLLLVSLCVGCSKIVESDLNLKCEGTHTHSYTLNGVFKKTDEKWKESISFKDRRRYSIEDSRYLSEKCQIWTNENIQCVSEKNEEVKLQDQTIVSQFLSSYVVNRVTGEIKVRIELNDDKDYFTGICEKIEGMKF